MIDLSKGCWQISLEQESKRYTVFVSNSRLYQFEMMPFGLVNAAATFSSIMRKLLQELGGVHNYIDDALIHPPTGEEHVTTIGKVLKQLRKANLTARPSKWLRTSRISGSRD